MTRKVLIQNGTGLPETAGVFRGHHTSCKWTHTAPAVMGESLQGVSSPVSYRPIQGRLTRLSGYKYQRGTSQGTQKCGSPTSTHPLVIWGSEAATDDGHKHSDTVKLYTLHKTIFKVLDSSPIVISRRDMCKYQEWGRTLMEIAARLLED